MCNACARTYETEKAFSGVNALIMGEVRLLLPRTFRLRCALRGALPDGLTPVACAWRRFLLYGLRAERTDFVWWSQEMYQVTANVTKTFFFYK